jgi:hypothetical protein
LCLLKALDGRTWCEASFRAAYEENVSRAKALVPPERLLVYKLGDGWEPLCAFLEVAVPDVPFPRTNDAQTFHKWVNPN